MRGNQEKWEFYLLSIYFSAFLMWLNGDVGRFHSLDLNQCIGGLGRVSQELNQASVDFKLLSPPTKEMRDSKGVWATLEKKEEKYAWKSVINPWNIMEKSWNFVIMEKWEPWEPMSEMMSVG